MEKVRYYYQANEERKMKTVTIREKEYNILRKQALLYRTLLKKLEKDMFPTEQYSRERIKEFMAEDRIDSKLAASVRAKF